MAGVGHGTLWSKTFQGKDMVCHDNTFVCVSGTNNQIAVKECCFKLILNI